MQGHRIGNFDMTSFSNVRGLMDRIYKCIKGSSKADYREFTSACIALARMIDAAVSKSQKLPLVPELPQLLKKVCEQKDNEMFQPAIMVLLMSVKNAICFGWFTSAEGQELLRMSKELVDFFTGMGGWTPVDSSQASQVISRVMPRFYPLLTLQSVIVALEAKPGYEAMVCDFYVLKKPSTSEELRMFVIWKDNLESSACLVTPNHVNFLVNGKGVEKRSLTSMDGGPQMPSNVTSMLKIGTNLLQIVGDFPGSFLIAIALTTSKTDYSSPLDLDIFTHDGTITQSDEELIEGPSRVSLLCPISHKRITSPVKGASCKHHQCFDYISFMDINSRRPSWRCPCCNRNVSFPDLRLDLQMLKILKDCRDDAVDVMISEDGSWQTIKDDEVSNAKMAANQSSQRKDGNSPISGDSSAEEGEIRFEKNNSNYIELSDTEDQERHDHESARHSIAIVNLGVTGGGDINMEDRKPDVRDISVPSSTHDQMETAPDGSVVTTASIGGEPLASVTNSQSLNFTIPALATEGGYNASEGLAERQASREINRPPIAIQALPAQAGTPNPSPRVRARTSSQLDSPAQTSGGLYPVASGSFLGANQRPLQVQLPSFVGIQDGQVLLHTGLHQQDGPENLPSVQTTELREYRQRAIQQLQQQRAAISQPFVSQPGVQPATRASREYPYFSAVRNVSQIRPADRQQTGQQQQQASVQQTMRPESPNLSDNHFWQQVRQQQALQLQSQLNNTMNIAREEILPSGLASVAEGVPMFNQSPGIAGAIATSAWRRQQTVQSTRTVSPQYITTLSNPLIVPNVNVSPRDHQRWVPAVEGISAHADTTSTHLADQMQRRMRGSINISSPVASGGLLSTNLPWVHTGSSQPSRFLSGASTPTWSNDALRHLDPGRASVAQGALLQSIQTASTLVSDFDNWLDTQSDLLVQHGFGDLGDPRVG